MMVFPALVLISALAETPVDPAELARAQSALESYFSRIEALQITYTENTTPPDAAPESQDPLGDPKLRDQKVADPTLSNDYSLLYAYPSLRLSVVERRRDANGDIVEHKRETVFHRGASTAINYSHKQFQRRTSAKAIPFPALPIDPLGLRVMHTLNTPISEFLKFPDITWLEGEDEVDGERAVVLKVGPHIPTSTRPSGWSEEAFIRVTLSPEAHYLPVRTELVPAVQSEPEVRFKMFLSSFQPVQDMARRSMVLFPHRLELQFYNGSKFSWVVQSAVINPPVSESDFVLTPPPGYFVAVDGVPQTLSGGAEQRDRLVQESAAEAKRLLGGIDPPRSSPRLLTRFAWPVGIAAVAIFVLVMVFYYQWRCRFP